MKFIINQEGMKIPKVKYDVFCKLFGTSLIKLNLTACVNRKIIISIPFLITENIDKYNKSIVGIITIYVIQQLQNMVQI